MVSGIFILGLVILVGFIGNVLYKTTKIPESIFLIILGILFGPVFHVIDGQFFMDNASFFLSLALVVVLMNSGLSIDIVKILKNTPMAFLFTFLVLIVTAGLTVFVTNVFFGWSLINGIILGVLGFGTELITLSDIVEKLKIGSNTKTIIILESVINDVILIIVMSILLTIVTKSSSTPILRMVLDMVVISVLLGMVFAAAWIYLFHRFIHGNPLEYVFTLGAAFFIYEIMVSLGFNGAICVLVFSLILGNYKYFLKWMKDAKTLLPVEKDILKLEDVNVQITFLVRTLFFFFIGFIFDVSIVRKEVLIFAFVFVGVLLVSRLLASGLLAGVDRRFGKSIPIFTIMTASGFIDTLYGVLAARAGVNIPNLTEIILLMVVLTTIISLIGMLVLEKFYVNKPTY